jgi:hypothetical protein
LEILRHELEQSEGLHNDYMTLKSSFNEIEKRCVKHQKSEIEVKKQLTVYKEFVVSDKKKSFSQTYFFISIFRMIYKVKFTN